MPASTPLRLDAALVREAKATARLSKRSPPKQIEYWADLGRAVESMLNPEQLLAVREGLAKIVVQHTTGGPVSSEEVFAEVERRRGEGDLRASVSGAGVRYQRCPTRPGHLERVAADGVRTVGIFRDGRFVPVEP